MSHFHLRETLRRYRGHLAAVMAFSILSNLLMLVAPIYMLQIYDRVLTSYSRETLLALTAVALFLLAIFGALEWVRRRLMTRVGQMLNVDTSDKVLSGVFRQRLAAAGNAQPINDLDVVRQFLSNPGIFAFFDAPWAPIFTIVVFLIHPWLGWVSLAGAALLFILALLTEYLSRAPLRQATEMGAKSRHFIEAALARADVLQAMGMFQHFKGKWRDRHEQSVTHQVTASNYLSLLLSLSKALRFSLQVIILGAGAWLVLDQKITPGMMIAASIVMGRALAPIEQSISAWRSFVQVRESWRRLRELMSSLPEHGGGAEITLPRPQGLLEAEDLTVTAPATDATYPGGGAPILRDIQFTFPPGTLVGIVGPSASGKSTLARTVLGAWPVSSGVVRMDGAKLDLWPEQMRRRHIGYSPQSTALFEGTVSENVARMGETNDEQVLEAARLAGCHEMITRLPEHYKTPLLPGAANLSAGQRQRIALAQAVYGDPALVVLDEPDSNLDAEGQSALLHMLRELRSRKVTVLLISHNPRLIEEVETLLLLRNGSIAALGAREEILSALHAERTTTRAAAAGAG